MISRLHLPRTARLLDIGTGTGGMIPVLSAFGELTVFEPSSVALGFTRDAYQGSHPGVTYKTDALSTIDGQFDVVTAFDVLEHCKDDLAALVEWSALIKPGGRLLLTVPAFPSLWGRNDELSHHYRRYTKQTLTDVLTQRGFSIQKMSYTYLGAFVPVWLSRNIKEKMETRVAAARAAGPDGSIDASFDDIPWDFKQPPAIINSALQAACSWEKDWLQYGDLPFGTSIVAIARKS